MERREFLGTAAAAAIGIAASGRAFGNALPVQSFELEEKTVVELQAMMSKGEMSAKEMTELYLRRIASVDKQINSTIEVNRRGKNAESLTARAGRKTRGPLTECRSYQGNIDTADKEDDSGACVAHARRRTRCLYCREIARPVPLVWRNKLKRNGQFPRNDRSSLVWTRGQTRIVFLTAAHAARRRGREQRRANLGALELD